MKKNLTLKQREERADRLAYNFNVLSIFLTFASIVSAVGGVIYLNWTLVGIFIICLFTACGTKALSIHFASEARELGLQRFEEMVKSYSKCISFDKQSELSNNQG